MTLLHGIWPVEFLNINFEDEKAGTNLLIEKIQDKYPAQMFTDKWEHHKSHHVESYKRKCYVDSIPTYKFTLITVEGGIHKFQFHGEATGKGGKSCYEGCGKITVEY